MMNLASVTTFFSQKSLILLNNGIKLFTALVASVLLTAAASYGSPEEFGPYEADYLSTYDGDTFWARIHSWPSQYVVIKVRVIGVDTPEFRSSRRKVPVCEKKLAEAARAYTSDFLRNGENGRIRLERLKTDKYGDRVDAVVLVGGQNLANKLIETGLGRPYQGGKRMEWCQDSPE